MYQQTRLSFFLYLSLLLTSSSFFSCGSDSAEPILPPAEQLTLDIAAINNYLTASNLDAEQTSTGLHFFEEVRGDGLAITEGTPFNVLMTSRFLDGGILSETDDCSPVTITLDQLIPGLQEGFQLFNVGGKGIFYVPSGLAFGPTGTTTGIPQNANLVFDFEIIDLPVFERNKIQNYLMTNNIEADSTNTGIFYTLEETGEGENPMDDSRVTVTYRGYFLNGEVFDESVAPVSFNLNQVIQGWQQAVPLLKPGGKGTFIIPSELAYGPQGNQRIAGNTILVFDIELRSFE
ncbi:MAG: FKBP-type peptidyl-prolyl cis-trans isomerase [Bacteroidota bacterium]